MYIQGLCVYHAVNTLRLGSKTNLLIFFIPVFNQLDAQNLFPMGVMIPETV